MKILNLRGNTHYCPVSLAEIIYLSTAVKTYAKADVNVSCSCQTFLNSLSANPTKWSNTLKQFVGNLPTNCLSVFDHFMNLALNGLISSLLPKYFVQDGRSNNSSLLSISGKNALKTQYTYSLLFTNRETFSEPSQTSKMEHIAKVGKPLTIFAKSSILNVRLGSENASKIQFSFKKRHVTPTKNYVNNHEFDIQRVYVAISSYHWSEPRSYAV